MQKETDTNFYCALPLGLFLCVLVGVAPVFGQEMMRGAFYAYVREIESILPLQGVLPSSFPAYQYGAACRRICGAKM